MCIRDSATTPRGLAEAFGVAWDSVVAWNDLDPQARLQPGQVLQLLVPRTFSADAARVDLLEQSQVELIVRGSREHIEAGLRDRGLVRRGYRIRKGDDLAKIGKKFDLSDGDLGRINNLPRDHVPAPGALLVVYVARGRERGTIDPPPPRQGHDQPTPAPEPTPEPDAIDDRIDTDPEPGPGIMLDDAVSDQGPATSPAGPSTASSSKLPGKQGWTRKPSRKPKTGKPTTGKPDRTKSEAGK